MKIVTCIAPVNIAVIKYWGKRDEDLILPINDSISATLSTDNMCAKTTIMASPTFTENKLWLNGTEESFENPRLKNCLQELKKQLDPTSPISQWKLHICSENNFPTAAGLASSAAGYACLVATLAALYGVQGDISAIARRGSGSACRSVHGGWVRWHKGVLPTGEDSIATQIAPALHWPHIRIIILVVNDTKKKYSSTTGMRRGVETSEFLKFRAESIVPKRISAISEAIKNKDFDTFARITMQDSNQFHSVCLDTFPPCTYMNDVSHSIAEMVHAFNDSQGSNKVAYTYDAGPNACLFTLEENVDTLIGLINAVFPPIASNTTEHLKGLPVNITDGEGLRKTINLERKAPGLLKYIIHTKVGEGPTVLEESQHLLDRNGLPLTKR